MNELLAEQFQRYKSGANWFYWIAGLTLVTSIISIGGGDWRFLISLGITQLIDAIGTTVSTETTSVPKIIAFILDLFFVGIFVLCGVLANKRQLWAYVGGMILFFLDGIIALLISDWIGVIAHIVVLIFMVPGFLAGRQLEQIEQQMALQAQAEASATSSL